MTVLTWGILGLAAFGFGIWLAQRFQPPPPDQTGFRRRSVSAPRPEPSLAAPDLDSRVLLLLSQHHQLEAIKLVRTELNLSLKEAKDYVERFQI
ncbi:hypothetical protein C7271_18175 [filamentous cyanobacterium CCP5]|nr:hypothetical protein C7271_18175 [filamentous cyanobacterium CCP5]